MNGEDVRLTVGGSGWIEIGQLRLGGDWNPLGEIGGEFGVRQYRSIEMYVSGECLSAN